MYMYWTERIKIVGNSGLLASSALRNVELKVIARIGLVTSDRAWSGHSDASCWVVKWAGFAPLTILEPNSIPGPERVSALFAGLQTLPKLAIQFGPTTTVFWLDNSLEIRTRPHQFSDSGGRTKPAVSGGEGKRNERTGG